MCDSRTWTRGVEIAGGKGGTGQRGAKEEKWDNCNNIIKYTKKNTRVVMFHLKSIQVQFLKIKALLLLLF